MQIHFLHIYAISPTSARYILSKYLKDRGGKKALNFLVWKWQQAEKTNKQTVKLHVVSEQIIYNLQYIS